MEEHQGGQRHHDHEHQETPAGEAFLQHAMSPCNLGVLPPPAVSAQASGTCGDSMELYMRVEDGRVSAVRFMPQGCAHTVACGSALTCLMEGRPLDQVAGIQAEQIEEELGGLPRDHHHCAVMAVMALRHTLRRYHEDRQSPWKRLYEK